MFQTENNNLYDFYMKTVSYIAQTPENWMEFITSSCRNYKCDFRELVMINAVMPNATAVLPMEQWNKKFARIVKPSATLIPVIDFRNDNLKIKHYIDVSDTDSTIYSKHVPIWTLTEDLQNNVTQVLNNVFNVNAQNLENAILSSVNCVVNKNISLNISDFLKIKNEETYFAKMNDDKTSVIFQNILKNSIAFMVFSRCGLETKKYFNTNDFKYIIHFNSIKSIILLGQSSINNAKEVLQVISKTVFQKNLKENNYGKTETNLHSGRELYGTTGLSSGREGATEQIRKDEKDISSRETTGIVRRIADDGQTQQTLNGDKRAGSKQNGNTHKSDETRTRSNGTTEKERPNEMGENDEQHQELSRGNSQSGIDFRLNYYDRNNEDKSLPFLGKDEDIKAILLSTPHLKATKEEIAAYFETQRDSDKQIEFIKSIFNNDFTEVIIPDGRRMGYKTYENVLYFWEGTYLSRTAQSYYDWGVVAAYFDGMRLLGELRNTIKSLPSVEGQLELIAEKAGQNNPAFSFSQEIIDAVLTRGSGISDGKMRIYEQFQKSLSAKDNVSFLKKEYGWGGSYPVLTGTGIDEMHDGKGIKLSRGFDDDAPELLLKWNQVEKRIRELISLDRYLNPKEKAYYPIWLEKQEQIRTERAADKEIRAAVYNTPTETKPVEYKYQYTLGASVFIGASEYEILSFDDDRVMLYDKQFPLFNKEMTRAEFDTKVKENPMNDHLKVKDEPAEEEMSAEEPASFDINEYDNPDYFEQRQLAELEPIVPKWEQTKKEKDKSFDLHPDIPMAERHTFDLKVFELEEVGKKARYHRNVEAIRILKECEFNNRFATPEEQQILAQYVGWGGIPEAFDKSNSAWADEFTELYSLLSPEEYSSARESTLTSFYTPSVVISAIYKTMAQMGFEEGNILEPSCGIGHFIGMLPSSMQNSRVYGIEIDKISAGIAQQLYQRSSIATQPFEQAEIPDSFFDAVVGNVPFGDFSVADKRYDKHHFLIHDYFFAKSLDKLRPGGIMAFITSKGTMDKKNPTVRKYIAQRADLLGAIRLPNNTFKGNAGTKVVSDILILQKRDRIIDIEPDWVHLDKDINGITMNSYFVNHPEMVLGKMEEVTGPFGMETTCSPYNNKSLNDLLEDAVTNIQGDYKEYVAVDDEAIIEEVIPAKPDVRNFSFTLLDGNIYYRENSIMKAINLSNTAEARVKGMIELRDITRELIQLQLDNSSNEKIKLCQNKLNQKYDDFTKKYGLINSRGNATAFGDDSSYSLLCSLEILDEDGNLEAKADMFTKRTIKSPAPVQSVDSASDALALSISEKAKVDVTYMSEVYHKTEQEIVDELRGVIFRVPSKNTIEYQTADEYLSGNVRNKLKVAEAAAMDNHIYDVNVQALKNVQPKDLSAAEIDVRLGSIWLPTDIIEEFVYELLNTPRYLQSDIKVSFSQLSAEWNISGKSIDRGNIKANKTYGTGRINAYNIIENTLNLKNVKIYDYKEDENGKKKRILNKKETAIALSKQDAIKNAFVSWIFKEPSRRSRLCKIYNERFNSIRPREYDGSHISFYGMNPEIELREHQKNAVAHILYGGNTLLAHVVGAGKTFEMVAAAMESKRLGLCFKSLFVVPNHLTEQWASEFLQLYPSANILVAKKKDFETRNRRKFCSRIATGDYDAVIIGHSQFEKIPMSIERQKIHLENQINEILIGIDELKRNKEDNFTVKQMEKMKKGLQLKLDKLNDQSRKDNVVTFEELGVDRLFVDESHYYKNLFLYTKMRNVGGIAQTEAQKSSDLFMKCRYLDEITDNKGVVFATGTPISNSMVEMYTVQRYLQYDKLTDLKLQHFDAWASTFGETVTAFELAPEGTGYRQKTRFAKFFNLPELMSTFKEVADIKTADVLNLPVPQAEYHNISCEPTEQQLQIVSSLAERAETVRNGNVEPYVDNMLKITNDGRKLALDQRLINEMLPDADNSKVSVCANNVFSLWEDTKAKKLTQLIFCDLSTPSSNGFNVYDDLREKLISRGIPSKEIEYIHNANTETKKQALFSKVRKGTIRVLIGSTAKMGAGTNVQDKLIAIHHLDCPWRPSDLQQREGRIIRQGNQNDKVHIYSYVTENTFDAYLYQLVENKQKFISQIMTSKSPVRSADDIDEVSLSYSEIKALATGNPLIKEKMDLDIQVSKLKLLKSNFLSEKYDLEDKIATYYPAEILKTQSLIEGYKNDIKHCEENTIVNADGFSPMKINNVLYDKKLAAGKAILSMCDNSIGKDAVEIGFYRGFSMNLFLDSFSVEYKITLRNSLGHTVTLGKDAYGNIQRIDNCLNNLSDKLKKCEEKLENLIVQSENAKREVITTFDKDEELNQKLTRLSELNRILEVDNLSNKNSNDKFIKVSPAQKEVLIANGYDSYTISDNGRDFIFKYSSEKDSDIKNLLNNINNLVV